MGRAVVGVRVLGRARVRAEMVRAVVVALAVVVLAEEASVAGMAAGVRAGVAGDGIAPRGPWARASASSRS